MISQASSLDGVLDSFDEDPTTAERLLQALDVADPETFLGLARTALWERPVSGATTCLTEILTSERLMYTLFELYLRSRKQALALAGKCLACQPEFDTVLLDLIEEGRVAERAHDITLYALDFLDAICQRPRLLEGAVPLLKHCNPDIRSKAAILLGRRQHPIILERLPNEPNARTRANIIEGLYGFDPANTRDIFLAHAQDENNRVACNSVLGLYLMNDPAAAEFIRRFAGDTRPAFRNSDAWLMGRIVDSQFSPLLAKMVTDPDERVRRQALRAIGRVKSPLRAV